MNKFHIDAVASHFRTAVKKDKVSAKLLPLDERLANYIIEGTKDGLVEDLDKKMAEWAATVPYANHLESKKLDSKWYRRHTIEHVWRIRLSRAAH